MATQADPSRGPKPSPASEPAKGSPASRARWTPPKIVRHGSVLHLVRGISGFLTDTFGMPGMRKA